MVGVEETEMKIRRQHLADGGFSSAHETDESDVLNLARGVHGIQFNNSSRVRTRFLRREPVRSTPPENLREGVFWIYLKTDRKTVA